MDIAEFIRARLDEDEALIRRNTDGRGLADGFPDYRTYIDADTDAADDYISHFGPSRLLRGVEAKRRIVADCERAISKQAEFDPASAVAPYPAPHANLAFRTLRALASEHDNHPDYRPEWAPTTEVHSPH